eukprot:2046555-Pyramimonas_sp.AAC.1
MWPKHISSEKICLDDCWPHSTRSCAMKCWQAVASETRRSFRSLPGEQSSVFSPPQALDACHRVRGSRLFKTVPAGGGTSSERGCMHVGALSRCRCPP